MTASNQNSPDSPNTLQLNVPPAPPKADATEMIFVKCDEIAINPFLDTRGESVDVSDLVESLREVGLLNPLSIRRGADSKFVLLAGHRRLRAAMKLGWTEIQVNVLNLGVLREELAWIDENLVRKGLRKGEKALQTARAKAIYEDLHPEAKQGGARRGSSQRNADLKKADSYAKQQAKATGRSESSIERTAALGKNASPMVIAALDAEQINQQEGQKLSKLPQPEQEAELPRVIADNAQRKAKSSEKRKAVKASAATVETTKIAEAHDDTAGSVQELKVSTDAVKPDGLPSLVETPAARATPAVRANSVAGDPVDESPLAQACAVYRDAVKLRDLTKTDEIAGHENVLKAVGDTKAILEEVSNWIIAKHPKAGTAEPTEAVVQH